jgi:putative transposase
MEHFSRNVVSAAPKALQKELGAHLRALLTAPDPATARVLLADTLRQFSSPAPQAVAVLEAGVDDATAVLALPEPYRTRLRTTNSQERLNEEIRRRERVIRIFPNRESALRLLGALLMEYDEQWSSGHRYLQMEAYWQWKREQAPQAPAQSRKEARTHVA